MDAGQTLDVPLGFASAARWMFGEVLTQQFGVVAQFTLRLGEANFQCGGHPPNVVFLQVTLDGAPAQTGEPDDLGVRQGLALEPEDFQFLLNAWMGVVEPLLADRG